MESRVRNFFLTLIIGILLSIPTISSAIELDDERELNLVIQPDIKRSSFIESEIKTADYEIIANVGIISIEDFGSNIALGLKLNYHISDDVFIGAEWVNSTGEETSLEVVLGGAPLLSDKQREMNTYLLTMGYNIFPGEAFITDQLTYNTSFYIIAGLGSTEFGGSDHFTASIGAGYRVLIGNYFSVYTDFRDNIFNADIFGKEKLSNNLKFSIGAGLYF